MSIFENWINDLPQQFKGKKNIEVLLNTFSRQLEEVYAVFEQLRELNLNTATGVNLDYEGNILSMTRKDAQAILKSSNSDGITDELYRSALKYRTIQLNGNRTYDDIMTSIKLLWNTTDIKYYENPEKPGYIYILLPSVGVDEIDPSVGRVLSIRPSGVNLVYSIDYDSNFEQPIEMKADVPKIAMKTGLNIGIPSSRISDVYTIEFHIEETIECSVVTKKDAWYLDGTYLLDGTQYINAEEIKEEL